MRDDLVGQDPVEADRRGVRADGRIACLSESTVAGFFESCLSSERRAAVEAHVDGCAACRRMLIELLSEVQLPSTAGELHTTSPAQSISTGGALARGTVVGRFVVLDLLGAGGMSVVYTAYDPELDRKVAMKLLHAGATDAGERRARILAEAQAMARINHANVTAVYDVGTYREQVFAAIELVEGTNLRVWMAQPSRTWREVAGVFLLAGEGLAAAHAANVIHRDFKPENVLVGDDGRVKVADFGLAIASSMTRSDVAGTPEYLPVELFRKGRIDERGDQFSFCVALYEALHGSRPFAGRRAEQLEAEVRRGPPFKGCNREVPARLNQVMRRGLALAPDERYPSMSELLVDLREAVEVRRWRRLVGGAVGAAVLALGIGAILGDEDGAATQPACSGAAAQLAGVWDFARRDAVRAAFTRTGSPSAAESFDRLRFALDRYADEWTTTWTDACEATEIRREQSAMLRDLRMVCLARARVHLRDRVDALVAADSDAIRDDLASPSGLPALDACSDVEMLQAIVVPSTGARARTRLQMTSASEEANLPVGVAEVEASPLGSRPDFRLPFGCGEAWQITSRPGHPLADKQIDFYLPGEGSSAGLAVYASAPGWVSHVSRENGEVHLDHGGGWSTIYGHMSDIAVSLDTYVGRGLAIGRVGNVNVKNSLGGPGRARLHYVQVYERRETPNARLEQGGHRGLMTPHLEGETLRLSGSRTLVRTSTNNCFGGGTPGGAVQFDVPISAKRSSRHHATMEIMVVRSDDHALFERWFEGAWRAAPLPHTIVGQPAVAVFEGRLHVIARKRDGSLLHMSYDPFIGWETTFLEGKVSADPDVGLYGLDSNLHVAARGRDGFLYHWWTAANGSWTRPVRVGHLPMVGTPAVFAHYGTLYIVARTEESSMWAWKADHRREWWQTRLPGSASSDPEIAVEPRSGRVNVLARGPDNRLHRWQSMDADAPVSDIRAGWSEPELIDPVRLVAGAPAATIYQGALHVFARGRDDAIEHWWSAEGWRWEATAGAYTGDLDVVQFEQQLQTVGRGPSGHLHTVWFDPVTGAWNVEDQGVSVD